MTATQKSFRARALSRLDSRLLGQALAPGWAAITRAVNLEAGAFLQVDCGAGWLCQHVASGRPELDAVGLDPDAAAVRDATNARGGRLNLSFRVMTADAIVYPNQTFHAAAAVMCSGAWADPGAVFAEIWRVLRPGASLFAYELRRPDQAADWLASSSWPRAALVRALLGRQVCDDAAWEALKKAGRASPFGGGVASEHGPMERLVLTRASS